MTRYDSRLITPPSEEEEIYPYRRVWLSIALEMSILFGSVLLILVITRSLQVPVQFRLPVNLAFALLPGILWLIFSWWRERFALRPRNGLIPVAIITGLVANTVGLPLIEDIFQPDSWLSLETAINRIVGYTFTVGLVKSMVIYLVVRFSVWPERFRVRLDGVAYGAASAIGCATVFNLHYVLTNPATPLAAAIYVFTQAVLLLCSGIIIGYGLSEVTFNHRPFPLLLAAAIALSAFVTGLATPLIGGLTNAGISPANPIGAASPILGLLFAAALLLAVSLVFSFLFNVAERHETESRTEDAESLAA